MDEGFIQKCQAKVHDIRERNRGVCFSENESNVDENYPEILEKLWTIEVNEKSLKKAILEKAIDKDELEVRINSSQEMRGKAPLYHKYWEEVREKEDFGKIANREAKNDLTTQLKDCPVKMEEVQKFCGTCLRNECVNTDGPAITKMMKTKMSFNRDSIAANMAARAELIDFFRSFLKKYRGEIVPEDVEE